MWVAQWVTRQKKIHQVETIDFIPKSASARSCRRISGHKERSHE